MRSDYRQQTVVETGQSTRTAKIRKREQLQPGKYTTPSHPPASPKPSRLQPIRLPLKMVRSCGEFQNIPAAFHLRCVVAQLQNCPACETEKQPYDQEACCGDKNSSQTERSVARGIGAGNF